MPYYGVLALLSALAKRNAQRQQQTNSTGQSDMHTHMLGGTHVPATCSQVTPCAPVSHDRTAHRERAHEEEGVL